MNQSELAAAIEVSRQAISAFEQGEKAPESSTLFRIAEKLGQPLAFFTVEDPPTFGEMSVRFFRAFGADTKRRNLICDVVGKWSAQITKYLDQYVDFPSIDVPSLSPNSSDGRFTDEEIERAAEDCRRQWGLGIGPISNVLALLEGKGIVVVRNEVPNERISAFSFWSGVRPFIFLASDTESAVRARYDALHELGHLILHRGIGPDELEDPKRLRLIEAEADRFAGAFLLPRMSFPNEVFTTRLDAFVALKARWKASIQALVMRCKNLGIFDDAQITNLYKQISYRKWRKVEPLDDKLMLERPRLLKMVVELVVNGGRRAAFQIQEDFQISPSFLAAVCNVDAGFFERKALSAEVLQLQLK